MVCGGREETATGVTKMRMKVRTAERRKRTNIQWEAIWAICSAEVMSPGRATRCPC